MYRVDGDTCFSFTNLRSSGVGHVWTARELPEGVSDSQTEPSGINSTWDVLSLVSFRDWSGSCFGVSPPFSTGSPGLKLSDFTVLVPNRVMVVTKVDCHASAGCQLASRQGVSGHFDESLLETSHCPIVNEHTYCPFWCLCLWLCHHHSIYGAYWCLELYSPTNNTCAK